MSASEISPDVPDMEKGIHKPETREDKAAIQYGQRDFRGRFFQKYVDEISLNVNARIGGYPASKFGYWDPKEDKGCNICGRGTSKVEDSLGPLKEVDSPEISKAEDSLGPSKAVDSPEISKAEDSLGPSKAEDSPEISKAEDSRGTSKAQDSLGTSKAEDSLKTSKAVGSPANCSHSFTLHKAAKEIAYLLKCRNLKDTEFWKVAEEEWKKEAEATQKIVDAKHSKVISLISEIYQLVGLAAAFQGLLITAAAQLSTGGKDCNGSLWWFVALSLFATAVTATGVLYKVRLVGVFQKTRNSTEELLNERRRLLMDLTFFEGPGFNLKQPEKEPELGLWKKIKKFLEKRVLEYHVFVLTCLIVFGVICGSALRFICK